MKHPPAVHVFSLRVAPILEYLHVVEEQANHVVCLVQLSPHFCCVLSWFPCIQQTNVLKDKSQYKYAFHLLFKCHPNQKGKVRLVTVIDS